LLEKKLAIASYTKALFVQKWQMFSESDRRGIQQSKPQMSTGYIDAHCYRLEGIYSSILGE
jgi:hypothetical protein